MLEEKEKSIEDIIISSSVFPKVILDAIEENEDDKWNIIGKIPVIGPILGIVHSI